MNRTQIVESRLRLNEIQRATEQPVTVNQYGGALHERPCPQCGVGKVWTYAQGAAKPATVCWDCADGNDADDS